MLTLGGLFSGVGGFELAWQRHGGRVAWMCEIDPKARKVLEHRFPGVPIHHDVTQLDPHEVEPVDVLTGGSPCQGFSIAGGRKGLEHHESRLFADHIRIMDGLAERGLQWAVWENVPGVLSISNDDGERTFPHVVAALVGADRPVHLDGRTRWNTGLADGGSRAVAWRVLDSRHFGVPQRRRRVYACVAFGGAAADRAGRALLAQPEGVRGDFAACQQARQDVAGTLGASVARSSGGGGIRHDIDSMTFVPDTARTLKARADSSYTADGHGNDVIAQQLVPDAAQCLTTGTGMRYDPETETLLPQPAVLLTMREGRDGGGKGPLLSEDESLTLATGNSQVLFDPVPVDFRQSSRGEKDTNFRLSGSGGPPGVGVGEPGDPAYTVSERGQGVGPVPIEPQVAPAVTASNDPSRRPQSSEVTQQVAAVHATGYGVRRLTPTECERLQDFPGGWTEPAGSDSSRYKALGNAVTVSVPEWLFGRMLKVQQHVLPNEEGHHGTAIH